MSDEVGKTQLHNSTKIAKSELSPVGFSIVSPTKNTYQSPSLEVTCAKKKFEKQKHLHSLSINPDLGLEVASVSTLGRDPLNILRPWPSCRESDSWPLAHPALKLASPCAFLGPRELKKHTMEVKWRSCKFSGHFVWPAYHALIGS